MILSDFFSMILGIDKSLADKNACRIEHVIDEELIGQIKSFSDFCIKRSINKQFMESKK